VRYLIAIFVFGLLIVLHELAHVLVARAFGIRVERLTLGMGPAFYALRRRGTELFLGAVPIGAHATILGMNPHSEALANAGKASFANRSPWVRLAVLMSGSAANYLFALVLLVILHSIGTHVPVRMTVGTVEPASVAAKAGIRPGDVIVMVNGREERHWSALASKVADGSGAPLYLRVQHKGEEVREMELKPRQDSQGEWRLGIAQQYVFRRHPRFVDALRVAGSHANALMVEGTRIVFRLLQGKSAPNPLVLLHQSSEGASSGARGWLRLTVALSIALMAFNLLPLPSFDGGRMLFVLGELITRKRIPPAREALLHTVGFWVLMIAVAWLAIANFRKVLPKSPPRPAETMTVPASE
jgi:regulator of sigma E protease